MNFPSCGAIKIPPKETRERGGGRYLHVSLQLIDGHGEVGVVVVVLGHVTAGLVQHREQRAQAAQPGEVHDVLHLGGVLQGLNHQAGGGEVRLQDRGSVPLDLDPNTTSVKTKKKHKKTAKTLDLLAHRQTLYLQHR